MLRCLARLWVRVSLGGEAEARRLPAPGATFCGAGACVGLGSILVMMDSFGLDWIRQSYPGSNLYKSH